MNDGGDHGKSQSLSAIVSPSHKVLIGDIYKGSTNYVGPVLNPVLGNASNPYYVYPLDLAFDTSATGSVWGRGIPAGWPHSGRHFGGANVAFVDGHVKWMNGNTVGLMFGEDGSFDYNSPAGSYVSKYQTNSNYSTGTNEFISYWHPTCNSPY
jgi:prepilin-type processing-associated H-X9-DG protein